MNVLLIGSGGREHALAWALTQSPILTALYCAPGNAGIAEIAELVSLNVADHQAVIDFCHAQHIDLVVVGPEVPLVAGLVDDLDAAGIRAFGPTRIAAQLEGSKGYTKDLCAQYHIPTAAYARFEDLAAAQAYVMAKGAPLVVKADGLAAGKGVTVAMSVEDAMAAIQDIFSGQAGASCVIEAFLTGEEASFFVLTDGVHARVLATAQDHKRAYDHDQGPNTGGMGAYSPAPIMTPALIDQVMREIIEPTVRAMKERGAPYKGVLYAGLMLTAEGPQLIEYNARFGDPECQVLMMRLKSDLLSLLVATVDGTLDKADIAWHDDYALTVVMASKGYPGAYEKGSVIRGLDVAQGMEGVYIFHAGTALKGEDIVAQGGRVLNVTAMGKTVREAQQRAYAAVDAIQWEGGFCRRDIGWRAVSSA